MSKLYTETIGMGPDIVLLHGWAIHSGIWRSVADKLADEFRVTLIDLPGFGQSDMIANYSMSNVIDQLSQVAPASALWLGWSLGGLIATQFALRYPDCVTKLICVASTPKFVKTNDWPGIEFSILEKFKQGLEQDYEASLMRFLLLQFHGMPLPKDILSDLKSILFIHGKPTIETLNASLRLLADEDLRDDLARLRCPTLYLLGKMDALIPAQIREKLSKLQSGIHCSLLKAGHAPFLSLEDAFLKQVRSFNTIREDYE